MVAIEKYVISVSQQTQLQEHKGQDIFIKVIKDQEPLWMCQEFDGVEGTDLDIRLVNGNCMLNNPLCKNETQKQFSSNEFTSQNPNLSGTGWTRWRASGTKLSIRADKRCHEPLAINFYPLISP